MKTKQNLWIIIVVFIFLFSPFITASHPVLTINSPIDNSIYNSKRIMINLSSDESISLYYRYNEDERWRKIASNINKIQRKLDFKEGLNEIIIKATDRNGSSTQIPVKFFIDSKKPKINKIKVDKLVNFFIEFNEENPVSLILDFNNSLIGFKSYSFNITDDCNKSKEKYLCEIHITIEQYLDLIAPYDGKDIEYWFELKDIVGNSFESKTEKFHVDLTKPIITNVSYKVDKKSVYFKIDIFEDNFKEVSYMDNSLNMTKKRKLCTRLDNGVCEKKVILVSGTHNLNITAFDKSWNSDSKIIEVLV